MRLIDLTVPNYISLHYIIY